MATQDLRLTGRTVIVNNGAEFSVSQMALTLSRGRASVRAGVRVGVRAGRLVVCPD